MEEVVLEPKTSQWELPVRSRFPLFHTIDDSINWWPMSNVQIYFLENTNLQYISLNTSEVLSSSDHWVWLCIQNQCLHWSWRGMENVKNLWCLYTIGLTDFMSKIGVVWCNMIWYLFGVSGWYRRKEILMNKYNLKTVSLPSSEVLNY